ncbi:uncharacterized protein LAJ45_04279 [Morchella importuna]|uniref:uncharacterized protein n=1 Tax=Morchella importuna TaxID=1174673 RepID=UPI001E8E78E1|nr:uncharacterized protein LAJ45_04279 [Morchella importuna]KAH8151657.1 hypothetical protein LAJ45_04279 [Morchella importuna]
MSEQEASNHNPCLAFHWSDSQAKTVEVVSSLNEWKLPGFKLERYSYGEFACFLGQQEPFDKIYFKFVIDGSRWEVNRNLPVFVDEFGNENNRWTPQQATDHHDALILHVQKQQTLSRVDMGELCRLALAAHGLYDQYYNELECIVDRIVSDTGRLTLPISGTLEVFVLLRFQPRKHVFISNQFERNGKHSNSDDVWVAAFPADTSSNPYLPLSVSLSSSEKERRMESECATLRFLKEHTSLPVPEVFSYDVRYPPVKDLTWEQKAHDKRAGIINKVDWPFILMEKLGGLSFQQYWSLVGNPSEQNPDLKDLNMRRQKIFEQLAMYQLELAKHPIAACGYLTLNLSYWHRPDKNSRTPKSSFGVRPCIFDTCRPFTDSVVAAFPDRRARLCFPLANPTNCLSSITARFNHLFSHNSKRPRIISDPTVETEKDHFIALEQMRSLVFETLGLNYETGPFILQHANLFPQNIFLTANSEKDFKISGIIDWDFASSVPIQISACPPRMCLGRLQIGNENDVQEAQASSIFHSPIFPQNVLGMQRTEYFACLKRIENILEGKEGRGLAVCRDSTGDKGHLSEVLRQEMVLPVYILDEICSTSLQALTGRVAHIYLPLIFEMIRGHKWDNVKNAILSDGAMHYAVEKWEKGQEDWNHHQSFVLQTECSDQLAASKEECLDEVATSLPGCLDSDF